MPGLAGAQWLDDVRPRRLHFHDCGGAAGSPNARVAPEMARYQTTRDGGRRRRLCVELGWGLEGRREVQIPHLTTQWCGAARQRLPQV
eukprot:scaffold187603_cov28-Tisochrysis_lutea.AAC.1